MNVIFIHIFDGFKLETLAHKFEGHDDDDVDDVDVDDDDDDDDDGVDDVDDDAFHIISS